MENIKDYKLCKHIFFILVICLLTAPIIYLSTFNTIYLDCAIQIKSGLWMIENNSLLPGDIFSWHSDLNWIQHETGWYFVAGLLYKTFGTYGILYACMLSGMLTAYICYAYNKNRSIFSLLLTQGMLIYYTVDRLYQGRPDIISIPILIFFITQLYKNKRILYLNIIFCISSFLLAWFHGGMIPLLFALYIVYIGVSLIKKEYKICLNCVPGLLVGFGLSLLQPEGINIWSYYLIQSGDENFKNIGEWSSGVFDIPLAFLVAIGVVGCCLNKSVLKLKKPALLNLAYCCMTGIMFCIYARFRALFVAVFVLVLPMLLDNIWKFIKYKYKLRKVMNIKVLKVLQNNRKNIASKLFCMAYIPITLTAIILIFGVPIIVDKDLNNVAKNEGYVVEVIDTIKSNNITKIWNSYNAGSWLAFNDVKVATDNRNDLYLEGFSGKCYRTGVATPKNIEEYIAEFDCDAVLLDSKITYAEYKDEYKDGSFLYYADTQDKYTLLYESFIPHSTLGNPIEVTNKTEGTHWLLYKINK